MNDSVERIGWLIDGVDGTPFVPCALGFSPETGITLEIPLAPMDSPQHIDWFDFDGKLPSALTYLDKAGPVQLLGIYSRGFQRQLFSTRLGHGRASARYAVIGWSEGDASRPESVRSEIEGLHEWLGWTGREEEIHTDSENRVREVSIRLKRQEPLIVTHEGVVLSWELHWAAKEQDGTRALSETSYFSTTMTDGADHHEHFDYHRALRDLINLSTWTACDYLSHAQRSGDSPDRTLDGRAYETPWRPVRTVETRAVTHTDGKPTLARSLRENSLFGLAELGTSGFIDWLGIRKEYERAYSPLISMIHANNRSVEEAMLATGIALEAIGYLDGLRRGETKDRANRRSVADRISLLVDDHATEFSPLIGGNAESWVSAMSDAYNGVKHANRVMPDPLQLHLLWQSGVWLVRLHLADRLGLKQRASERAPQTAQWRKLLRLTTDNAAW